jgi:hypothetical protein
MLLGDYSQPHQCIVLDAGEVDLDTRVEQKPLELLERTIPLAAGGRILHLRPISSRVAVIWGLQWDILYLTNVNELQPALILRVAYWEENCPMRRRHRHHEIGT